MNTFAGTGLAGRPAGKRSLPAPAASSSRVCIFAVPFATRRRSRLLLHWMRSWHAAALALDRLPHFASLLRKCVPNAPSPAQPVGSPARSSSRRESPSVQMDLVLHARSGAGPVVDDVPREDPKTDTKRRLISTADARLLCHSPTSPCSSFQTFEFV